MQKNKKWGSKWLLVLLALALVVSACSSEKAEEPSAGGEGASKGGDDGPFEISISLNFDGQDIPEPDNPVQKAIEEYTNTKLNINYVPGNAYQERLSTMIASGDMPQVVASYGPPKQSFLLSAFQNDVFWDISPYIEEFPNLSKLNPIIYENVSFQGGIYGLPRERPLARDAFIYRADWLEKLGMKEPETIDEFYEMLVAFRDQDPDGNNQNDTYGLSTGNLGGSNPQPNMYAVFMGAPNVWEVDEDGKFTRDVFHPAYLEGLKFQRRLYEEGLMHPDFAVMDRPKIEGEFTTGKAGVLLNTTNTALTYEARLKQTIPDAEVSFFSILSANGEKRVPAALGSNGILMFPKSSVPTEEELKRILTFFDKLGDQEMVDLLAWGIEGVHHEIVDGKPQIIDHEKYDREVTYPYKFVLSVIAPDNLKTPGHEHRLVLKEIEVTTDNTNYLVNNPANPLVSQTQVERGGELEQIIRDANTKFIMGVIDEDEWKAEMDRWWSLGGEQIARELEEEWKKTQ